MGGAATVHGGRGGASSVGKKEEAVQEVVGTWGELRKYGRLDYAIEVMEWMQMRKMNVPHAIYLDLIAKNKGITAAENYFDDLSPSEQNHSTHGALLSCYCRELMSEKALTLFEKMDEMKFLSNSLPFNNLMSLHMRLGQPEKLPAIVQEMKQKGVSPCTFTYNMWMQSHGCLNDFEGVERVLDEMKMDEEQIERGRETKKKRRQGDYREAYHFLITLYAGTSNLGEVNRVWSSLKSNFQTTTNVSYLTMLHTLAKLKDVEGLLKCFKEWESSCHSYDMRLANVAIRACLEHDLYEEAALIFDDALTRTKGLFFNAREMEIEWQPEPKTLSAFFAYFEDEKDVDGAERLCKILKHINRLDSNAYDLLLKTYIAAGKLAPEMRQRLEEDGIEINPELENLLERVCPK
ncbi:hypothetical protein OIU85_011220 [Salix viminalis]|uniref:Pentacotripeptide-repeat region of PRORP domain-containing protein n=1 Tax=Salix viminalis TaxID=40686 RepID=A0A9Q0NSB2_SALVM|nr:hypothetical protein OIU85_011220 [Salix viminalis]